MKECCEVSASKEVNPTEVNPMESRLKDCCEVQEVLQGQLKDCCKVKGSAAKSKEAKILNKNMHALHP